MRIAALQSHHVRGTLAIGVGLSLVLALAVAFLPVLGLGGLRERVFDELLLANPATQDSRIIVVDIDSSPDGTGDAAWSREKTAELVDHLAADGAAVVAFDLVFSTLCNAALPENAALVAAIRKVPVVLGFLLSETSDGRAPAPLPPLIVRQPVAAPDLWFANDAEASCFFFEAVAASSATTSLAGDSDALIRFAPAVVVVGNTPYPGLALEAVRIGATLSTPVFGGDPPMLAYGPQRFPVDAAANLRLRPTGEQVWASRTVSAADLLAGKVPAERLKGAIVFVGSSRPELGGLRPTAASPLQPSVQIHADLATELLSGATPQRSPSSAIVEAAVAGIGGAIAALFAVAAAPIVALSVAVAVAVVWAGIAIGTVAAAGQLIDPLFPAATILIVYAVASLLHYAETRRAEENLRRRFGQHMPAAIVTRFVENPALLKLEGEERVVTALFTDIEGFSTATRDVGPRDLIAMLDQYLGGITRIITAHGGTVDKFVGDAVHAFFNAPLDLDSHADKAIDAALEIVAFTEEHRRQPAHAHFGLGRTRIGIETGPAIVGDVGSSDKIDYTAYGNAVNLAARLEAQNKVTGTAICIGPGARAGTSRPLRSLGVVDIRGFGSMELFTTEAALVQSPTLA